VYVLGIETSCDDTGAAVVDEVGNVIGEAIHNQTKTHVQ
jgi:N6-L-threonylcarbamoyladenine synthase